jgi:hypothetical protein
MEAAGEDYRTGVLGIGGDQLGNYQAQLDRKREDLKNAINKFNKDYDKYGLNKDLSNMDQVQGNIKQHQQHFQD